MVNLGMCWGKDEGGGRFNLEARNPPGRSPKMTAADQRVSSPSPPGHTLQSVPSGQSRNVLGKARRRDNRLCAVSSSKVFRRVIFHLRTSEMKPLIFCLALLAPLAGG